MQQLKNENKPYFLPGEGEMSELTRNFNWEQSPLGIPDTWPVSLKTTVGIILNSAFPMFLFWGTDAICFYNDAFRPSLGVDGKHPAVGKPGKEVWDDIWEQISPWITQVMETGKPIFYEDQLVPFFRNGRTEDIYWTFSYSPVYGESGIEGVAITCFETTPHIKDNKRLTESEQKVRAIVDSAPFPIGVYMGKEMRIEFLNKSIMDVWGKGYDDLVGKTYSEVLPELGDQNIFQQLDSVFETGVPFHARNQRVDLVVDNILQPFYFNYSFTPVYDAEGKVCGVMNTAADVTDLHAAKQRIEQSEKNLRNMVQQSPVAMCILLGPEHVIEVANDLMIELWGKERDDVMGKPVFQALPDAKEQGLEEVMRYVYETGETFRASERPVRLLRKGQWDTVYQNFVYDPYKDSDGTILGVLAISIDVTQQVLARQTIEEMVAMRTEELRIANENLSRSNQELAQFAYIASHDLQEPVRKVSIFVQMLEKELQETTGRSSQFIEKIQNASSRMLALIRDVLSYSQLSKEHQKMTMIDLNDTVRDVMNDFELLISQRGAIVSYKDLPCVEGIPLQMSQLFGNLISNALKFKKAGRIPVITISSERLVGSDLQTKPELKTIPALDRGKNYYYIKVEDNGIGFDPEHAEGIFNIFQRLHGKKEFEGTGIGLSICKKIVQNHHGYIVASSVTNVGAIFHIILPVPTTAS